MDISSLKLVNAQIIVSTEPEAEESVQHVEDADLRRMLSLRDRSDIVTATPSMPPNTRQRPCQDEILYRKIGAGACGAIFAAAGEKFVYKFAKTTDNMLWNDYQKHIRIWQAFNKFCNSDIHVPNYYYFIDGRGQFTPPDSSNLRAVVASVCNLPASHMVSQRIPPLSRNIRNKLIETFCAPSIQEGAYSDPASADCLVRVYLGSQEGKVSPRFFSLRNFKLHLNQMVHLHMDVRPLAKLLGHSLAVLHCEAETDARDVEFVLGGAQGTWMLETLQTQSASTGLRNILDSMEPPEFWVLDFNQVGNMTLDERGVEKALDAVKVNDPYFPKPLQESADAKVAWNTFALEYYDMSRLILERKWNEQGDFVGEEEQRLDLLLLFLQGLVDMERKRQASRNR